MIADESADPDGIAHEMLAQAEHDPDASVVLVTTTAGHRRCGRQVVDRLLPRVSRSEIIVTSFDSEELCFSSIHSMTPSRSPTSGRPSTCCLPSATRGAWQRGFDALEPSVWVPTSSVVFGDYMTGANHVLPTDGAARYRSGLSTEDFVRWTTHQSVSPDAARTLSGDVAVLADAEKLYAHAATARRWSGQTMTAPTVIAGAGRYRGLACYVPDQAPVRIDLRDNTNLWGLPPGASRAIADAARSVCRYPGAYTPALRQALADYLSLDAEMIVTGCGSDDVIDASFRALADPGDRIAMLSPSFSSAVSFAKTNALTPVPCPLTSDWRANVDCLVALDARVIYLCSPNNPTGGPMPRHAIERLLARATAVIIIDEAYAEYAGVSACDLLGRFDHLLVIRTLSKAFGLAGLRVGYAVGHPGVVTEVAKARGPYKVNGIAERAAVAALSLDREWVSDRVHETMVTGSGWAVLSGSWDWSHCRPRPTFSAVRPRGPRAGSAPCGAWVGVAPVHRRATSRGRDPHYGRARGLDAAVAPCARTDARGRVDRTGRPMTIAILDYGVGNLHSLRKALASVDLDVLVVADPQRAIAARWWYYPAWEPSAERRSAERWTRLAARGIDERAAVSRDLPGHAAPLRW